MASMASSTARTSGPTYEPPLKSGVSMRFAGAGRWAESRFRRGSYLNSASRLLTGIGSRQLGLTALQRRASQMRQGPSHVNNVGCAALGFKPTSTGIVVFGRCRGSRKLGTLLRCNSA